MQEFKKLYQETILDHSKNPRNFHVLDCTPYKAEGFNTLCGDRFTVYVDVVGDRIRGVTFQGNGCAISKASASMMTVSLRGKTLAEARELLKRFHDLATGTRDPAHPVDLGKLEAFAGLCEYPARVKCATLAWHTLGAALEGNVST